MTYQKQTKSPGFTLVELSIVIIIIGFLIAGIAAGQSLIKQAAINSVITDMQAFQTAYNSFVLRYYEVPGDMTNPDNYWPAGSSGCAITAGNCDGNGNGLIEYSHTLKEETYSAWRELALSGDISLGIPAKPDNWDGGSADTYTIGVIAPASKVSGAGYIISGTDISSNANIPWSDGITNAVYIAKPSSNGGNFGLASSAILPVDAFNMDQKIDDGTIDSSGVFTGAGTGNFRTMNGEDFNGSTATSCVNNGVYQNITTTQIKCISALALN